jgi:branched-chain amino acid transport system permease protein
MKGLAAPSVALLALLAAAALAPLDRHLMMEILLVFAMAQGWNLLCGYTGLFSFGHQAFVGLGAYTLYAAVNHFGVAPFSALPLSALSCVAVALAMAWLLRGARDAYFSVGIWVLADSLRLLFGEWDYVGGSRGLVMDASAIDADSFNNELFVIALALAAVTLIGMYALLRSRVGLSLMAARDNEQGAASVGIPVARNRLMAFLVSAVICGLGGAVYYLSILYVDPTGAFDLDWQIRLLFIVIVGGVGTIEGPVVGTILYFGLRESMRDAGDLYLIVQGAATAIIMIFAPEGLWGMVQARTGLRLFPVSWSPR